MIDKLIAILDQNTAQSICELVACRDVNCTDCPFYDEVSLASTISELVAINKEDSE